MQKPTPRPASPDAIDAAQSWRMVPHRVSAGGSHEAQDVSALPLLH